MCKIYGFTWIEDEQLLDNISPVMQHNGSYGKETFIDSGTDIGPQRLSKIDLEGESLPIHEKNLIYFFLRNIL